MMNVTELRAGNTFKDSTGMWEVVKYTHTKIGRGGATIRVKAKNLKTGALIEKTFNGGQKVEDLVVEKSTGQFLYSDKENLVFMNKINFEQFNLPVNLLGEKVKFLKDGEDYDIVTAEGEIISVEIPRNVILKVEETGPSIKGDSVSAATKDAKMENGMGVKVPLFIAIGDKLKIDTRTGEYLERVR